MAQTKLKRSIFIGLGGTGIKTLIKTKKMFIDNYGVVPPMIQFLGIDTDGGEYGKTEKLSTSEITLSKSEQCSISVEGEPIQYYNAHKKELGWMPLDNVECIDSLDRGAGQVRTNGRLAFVYNITNLQAAITNAYANATSHNIVDNPKYAPNGEKVDIHIVFSIAGGTGCGTFLDVAYLLRKMYGKSVGIYGYAIMPRVFVEMMPTGPAMIKTRPNAFGALQDLDFLMHLKPTDDPVTFNWIAQKYDEKDFAKAQNPFDLVYMIDNTNSKSVNYSNVLNLSDVISLALVSASGELGTTTGSIFDNVVKTIREGGLNVNNKRAWVSSLGASEIVFKGQEVANDYANKAIYRLIQRATNAGKNGNALATRWIDEVKIREDNGKDEVINFLYDMTSNKKSFEIEDKKSPKAETENFCSRTLASAASKAESACDALTAEVSEKLQLRVSELLKSGDYCVTSAREFLESVRSQINHCMSEMVQEKIEREEQSNNLAEKVNITVNTLKEHANRLMFKGNLNEMSENVVATAAKYVENEVEIKRRLYAIQFYNAILAKIDSHLDAVKKVSGFMQAIASQIDVELDKNTGSSRSKTMDVDLSIEIIRKKEVKDDEIVFENFYSLLDGKGLEEIETSDELFGYLKNYAESLNEYKRLKDCSVTEIINSLSDEDFRECCRLAIEKAEPLLKINGRGKTVKDGRVLEQAIAHSYFICVGDKSDNRFEKDKAFTDSISITQKVEFVATGFKDRVIFYRQDYVIPAFAISTIDDMRLEYQKAGGFYHYDKNIKALMDKSNYSIDPSDTDEQVLGLWVQGLIFGLIKYDTEIGNGSYTFYNRSRKDCAVSMFWVDTKTYYRDSINKDSAFQTFANQSNEELEAFAAEIERLKSAMGQIEVERLKLAALYPGNYELLFSQYPHIDSLKVIDKDYEERKALAIERMQTNAKLPGRIRLPNTASQAESAALIANEIQYVREQLEKEF